MLRFCCPILKRNRREEQYHVKHDDTPIYTWEKERLDPAQYRFVDLYGEIVAKLDGHISGEQFVIERCKECCILLLDHIATVNIDNCENNLIVLGPCKGSVFIRDCENCTVFTACQQFRSRDCQNIDIFLFCTTKPIIESSKAMRFRSLALCYDKLKEHMIKASLSPFANNWNKVHDFTPEDNSNFEICPTTYNDIENIDLVKNLEKVKFAPEISFFPQYQTYLNDAVKRVLILCIQRASEISEAFYDRVLKMLRTLLDEHVQLIATKDILIKKGEMGLISKKYAKISGRLVTLELAGDPDSVVRRMGADDDLVEIVKENDFEHYRTCIYRLAQSQMDS